MSEQDPFGTLYRFVPSVRRGFQPEEGFTPDGLPDSAKPGFGVTITAKGKARKEAQRDPDSEWDTEKEGSLDLSLYGPGDVEGLDHSQIARAEPDPGTQQFQPNYFPFVSFDRPDLPWLFSPERAGQAGRIRPWLTLVTVEKQEGVSIQPSGTNPLPVLTFEGDVDLTAELPPPDETWAWAHAQLHGAPAGEDQSDWMDWAPEQLGQRSNVTVSRLVSPRNLDRGTDYYAAVVPTFDAGRLAGLGEDPYEDGEDLRYAWSLESPPELPFELPVYYYWEFATTDREVSFEKYVEDLETVSFGEDVGTKEIDATDPGPVSLQPGGGGVGTTETIAFGGALISEPGRDKVDRLAYGQATQLRKLLNKPETLRQSSSGPTLPIVGPPLYGQWHAGLEGIPTEPDGDPNSYYDPIWFRELNQNVRNRGAASRGAKIVKRNQGALMNAAWEVAGEIREANRAIRNTQTAGSVGDAIERHHGVGDTTFTPGEFAKHSSRTIERINRMAMLEDLLGSDGLPSDPGFGGEDPMPEEYRLPDELETTPEGWETTPGDGTTMPGAGYTMPGEGYTMPRGGYSMAGGDGSTHVERYAMANSGSGATDVSGVDPVRIDAGAAGTLSSDVETTDPMLGVTGSETPRMTEEPDPDVQPDGGAAASAGDGAGGLYAQFLQDLDARPETSRQFQRLVRLDGPLANRTGITELDYERLIGEVTAETVREVEVLADDVQRRTQVRSFSKGSEYWLPPAEIGTFGEHSGTTDPADGADESDGSGDSDAPGEQAAASGEGEPTQLLTGYVAEDVATARQRTDRATAPGMGTAGRTAPLPTMSAEREYQAATARLDDRLPPEERAEVEPAAEATDEGEEDGVPGGARGRGSGLEPAVAQLESIESHAGDVLDALPDGPGADLDVDAVRAVGRTTSLIVDGAIEVDRTVTKAVADEDVTLPAETEPEAVRSGRSTLSTAVDELAATLPADSETDGPPAPAAVEGDEVRSAARTVRDEARALRGLLGGVAATVPMSLQLTSASSSAGVGDPMRTPTVQINRSVLGTVAASATQSTYFRGRLSKRIASTTAGQFVEPADPVESVMMAPEFPTPMWRPLKELATEYMLPGIEAVPQDSIGLLTENREFIEAYLAGLNHEFARELLWRGFPTDRRGTYFKRFWNKGRGPAWDLGMGVDTDDDSPRDVGAMHEWDESPLGNNEPPGADDADGAADDVDAEDTDDTEGDSPDVVLLLRSRLFKLFPHVNVYAGRAYLDAEGKIVPTTPEQLGGDHRGSDDVQFPSYRGELGDDVTFLGFDLTVDEVSSAWSDVETALDGDDPYAKLGKDADGTLLGYYFVFEERPGEIRFGFDQGSADTADRRPLGIAKGSDVSSVIPSWAEPLQSSADGGGDGDRTGDVDRTGWADFSWHTLVGSGGSPDDVSYVTIEGSKPQSEKWRFPSLSTIESELDEATFEDFTYQFDDPPNAHDPAEWGKNSAHMARIAWQKPVRMSRHANLMLPDDAVGDDSGDENSN